MSYIGNKPPQEVGELADNTVTTSKIVDGSIVNADINSSAAIALSKLASDPSYDDSGVKDDIALLGFKVAANGSLAAYNLKDQTIDAFEDASGIDASGSTNEARSSSNYVYGVATPTVTGGTTSTSGDYTYHHFTSSGNYVSDRAQTVDYLIVAGGGGGGWENYQTGLGGGGGGGGVVYATGISLSGATHSVTVGNGGSAGSAGNPGVDGGDSSFNSMTAVGGGGGGGGATQNNGSSGGSGGGGGHGTGGSSTQTSPSGATGYGNAGGNGDVSGSAGGGGGAGSAGSGITPGNGRLFSDFTSFGDSGYFGGGGGGGDYSSAGSAGNGGGGNGKQYNSSGTGQAGTANTGGGGGNGQNGTGTQIGGAGGSGTVIIKRPTLAGGGDLTLVSTSTTADSTPTTGDIVMTYTNGAGTATVNTDLKAYVSRDNGTTWTQATLSSEGTTGGHTILTAHNVDISSQPSGTSMRYKIETLNQSASKETRIQAVSLGWS